MSVYNLFILKMNFRSIVKISLTALAVIPMLAIAQSGNTSIESFNQAKRLLETKVYYDHRVTLYCGAAFDDQKNITLPQGFTTTKHVKRASRVEWEHVVAAENFGRTFIEWREGSPDCVDKKGKLFKGRNCAQKVNAEYRLMQSDLYNLYPAIGAVNAMRQNYNFQMLPGAANSFGSCEMKIEDRKAEPPERARGQIARTHLYMQHVYPRFKLSSQQDKLMTAWNKTYPVDKWECTRAKRIEAIQGNENRFVKDPCKAAGLW